MNQCGLKFQVWKEMFILQLFIARLCMVEIGPYETCPSIHFFSNSQYCWLICCEVYKDILNAVSIDGIAFICANYFS